MLYAFIVVIGLCSLLAWHNWRWGLMAAILVGLLQDPVRKMLPGVPAYLTLSTVPIWLALAAHVVMHQREVIHRFLQNFPVLARRLSLFGVYLVIPAMISLTYGRGTWQITLLGVFVYSAGFGLIVAGWASWENRAQIDTFLGFYALAASVLLVGGLLEQFGWGARSVLIGAEALGHSWVTHRTGEAVYMLAGFFRSPDVMGWHAVTVVMIAFVMAWRSEGGRRYFWVGIAIWGLLGLWLCGRRKMVSMIPIFVASYFLLVLQIRGTRRILGVVALTVLVIGAGLHLVGRIFQDQAAGRFYMTVLDEWDDQVIGHGYRSVITTVNQAGFLGYGLGMSQQGVHNIDAETPRLWQESGPSKLFAELGVPGAILFLILGYALLRTGFEVARLHAGEDAMDLFAGLFSLFVANLASSVVSAQIYGDPFVLLFLAFLMGTLLAGGRLGEKAEMLKC